VHLPSFIARRRRRSAITALLVVAQLSVLAATSVQATGGDQFVSLTNVKRASVGKGPVALYAPVDQIAVERGNQMARNDVMAHDLTYVSSRLTQLGVCWTGVGEIIAWEKGYPSHSYQRTIDAWWASPEHHAIMIGDYNVAGGSWSVSASGATYSVMIFVKTCSPVASALSTDAPPSVVARSPGSGASGVILYPVVKVGFSEAVRGVRTTDFVLRDAATGAILSAAVSYDSTTHSATLDPTPALGLGRAYRVSLSGSIKDSTGQSLPWTSWTFRATTTQSFNPQRTVSFAAGTYTGYRFSSTGVILGRKSYRLGRSSAAPTSKRAIIAGQSGTWYYITAGVWTGYWVRASTGVVLH
jgi:uncharacterized protein YkwD